MAKSLPSRPDLRWLRDQAKARRRTGEFPSLALAHLAIAREYGFASWPRLKAHVDALTLDAAERAAILIASACSSDPRRATTILALDPGIARHDLATACVVGDAGEVARRVAAQPESARQPTRPHGWPPLLYACFSRLGRLDPDVAAGIRVVGATLLDAGADPNAYFLHGDWRQTPIYGAAGIAGDPQLTALLLDAGADPNDADDAHTVGEALYHACEHPEPACGRLLIDAGTEQSVVDYCLGRALNFDNHAMIAMFCTHGARPTAGHLHQAVWRRRSPETIAVLLDAGAPLDEPDDHGRTPLQIAWLWGDEPTADLLHARGAVVPHTAETLAAVALGGGPPVVLPAEQLDEMILAAIDHGDLTMVRRLLDWGAHVDGAPGTDDPPLRQACWRGRVAIVGELLARGAATAFPDGGSAIGATLHGSRHCQDPEAGPTMAPITEIDPAPYAEIIRLLLAAHAEIPPHVGTERPTTLTLLAELGITPTELGHT